MLPKGVIRDVPNRLRPIPMWSPKDGELHRGYFLVPADMVEVKEHSNRSHQLKQHIQAKVTEWAKWKSRQGYMMVGKPTVYAPVESPTPAPDEDPVDGAELRIYVSANFTRKTPLYGSNDDLYAQHADAARYGVNPEAMLLPTNPLPSNTGTVIADSNRKPLELAAARRKQLGLKRTVQTKRDKHGDTVADGATVSPQ